MSSGERCKKCNRDRLWCLCADPMSDSQNNSYTVTLLKLARECGATLSASHGEGYLIKFVGVDSLTSFYKHAFNEGLVSAVNVCEHMAPSKETIATAIRALERK